MGLDTAAPFLLKYGYDRQIPSRGRQPRAAVTIVPAATTASGIPIVHADTVSISDEARVAYRRMFQGSS